MSSDLSDVDLVYLPATEAVRLFKSKNLSPVELMRATIARGIQLVGRTYCDADVFRAGLAYERARGEWFTNSGNRPNI